MPDPVLSRPRSVLTSIASPTDRPDEDRALLAAGAALVGHLGRPDPHIYWSDLTITAIIAYGAFASMVRSHEAAITSVLAIVALLAFYRGSCFIHELSHLRRDRLPGFAAAWNILFGIPLLMPSFLYRDVHSQHHAKHIYGTARDPEYLPLAGRRPHALATFVAAAALAPIGLLLRFAVLAPLSLLDRRLRRLVVERCSALAINPAYRRRAPTGAFRREWYRLEAATSLWAIALLALVASGRIAGRAFILVLLLGSGIALLNQLRTLVAHLWGNHAGEPMSLTAQYLDSINVPPPASLPALWAPVGLRYHALHHLLPSVPYHALGAVHRELGTLEAARASDHRSMMAVVRRIAAPH